MLTQQATIIAYDNTFKLLMILTLIALPLVLLIGSSRATKIPGPAEVHALD
jgi:DHA2 family multidrug resistance protein